MRRPNPHTRAAKDLRDQARFRKALRRGLDLRKALEAATDGGKPAVKASAALNRVEEALRTGKLYPVRFRTHLGEAILKALVGEGYLRVERREKRPGEKARGVPDERFAPWVSYRLTRKGLELLQGGLRDEAVRADKQKR